MGRLGAADRAVPPTAQDGAHQGPPHHQGDHRAARERGEVAQHAARSGTVMDGGTDLPLLGHHGVWERLLELAQQRDGIKLGMAFIDGTTVRAHQEAAGATKKRDSPEQRDKRMAPSRTHGGFSTKASVIVDGSGRAIGFALAPGQANDSAGPHCLES